MNKFKLPILIYDNECTLCQRFKDSLIRIGADEIFSFATIHDQELYEAFSELDKELCDQEFHIIDEDNKIYAGADALTYLVHRFPATSKFSWLMESNIGQKTTKFFYDTVAKYRQSSLNKCNGCKQ